jgi:hypothetical protein
VRVRLGLRFTEFSKWSEAPPDTPKTLEVPILDIKSEIASETFKFFS